MYKAYGQVSTCNDAHDKILKKKAKIEMKQKIIDRKIKCFEAHPSEWKRIGFDRIAPIPDIIRVVFHSDDNDGEASPSQ